MSNVIELFDARQRHQAHQDADFVQHILGRHIPEPFRVVALERILRHFERPHLIRLALQKHHPAI